MSMKDQLRDIRDALHTSAQERLEARTYIVRVIDERDGWTKLVASSFKEKLVASKKNAQRFQSLRAAVYIRDHFNKQKHIRSAWIVFN